MSGSVQLDNFDIISDHWPAIVPSKTPQIHVLVEVVSGKRCAHWNSEISLTVSRFFALDHTVSPARSETLEDRAGDYRAITIRAIAQGDLGGQDAIESNHISELHGTEPDFLKDFKTRLGRRRWIEPGTVCFFQSHTTVVTENRHSALRFSGVNFASPTLSLTTTFKMYYSRTLNKETASPAKINCRILQARFYTRVGMPATSKRIMFGGSLTRCRCTSNLSSA
jgi:hypothetical protein